MKQNRLDYYHDTDTFEPLNNNKAARAWSVLLKSDSFQKKIKLYRDKYSVPPSGMNTKQFDEWLSTDEVLKLTGDLIDFMKQLKIEPVSSWFLPLIMYIICNKKYAPYLSEVQITQEVDKEQKFIDIKIFNHMGKTEFLNFINNRWDEISAILQTLPKIKVRNIPTLDLAKKICGLRKKQKSFAQIADILSKDYPDDEIGRINEDYMKTLYHRYKKILS
ncbi:MAG: hypothetical protein NUV65_06785 [Candidatus Roizmanbacteria bacterium]|nr:hypothetical protein [Candidatus Roizmanbacteria bacterium]